MKINYSELSKTISHALRHVPWVYELELDEEGWISLEILVNSLRTINTDWENIDRFDIEEMILTSSKKRHEIRYDKIRALYGHSIPGKLAKVASESPETLYHGTTHEAFMIIQKEGLKPMNRQYVHLSTNLEIAQEVGKRKTRTPVILKINTKEAFLEGSLFYKGNENVWLSEFIPDKFVTIFNLVY